MGLTPNTLVRTSHAITIRAGGITVGLIQSWAPSMNRGITAVYEINAATSGEPIEKVPGNVGGLTISVSRYDLYSKRMETAFGTPNAVMLGDHNNPFSCLEQYRFPDNTIESYLYTGVWFSNLGRTYSATDARLVLVNATLEYTRKLAVLASLLLRRLLAPHGLFGCWSGSRRLLRLQRLVGRLLCSLLSFLQRALDLAEESPRLGRDERPRGGCLARFQIWRDHHVFCVQLEHAYKRRQKFASSI